MNFLEVKRALPELIGTAKDSEEEEHYKTIDGLSEEELKDFIAENLSKK